MMLAIRGDGRGIVAQIDRQHDAAVMPPGSLPRLAEAIDAQRDDVARREVQGDDAIPQPDTARRIPCC